MIEKERVANKFYSINPANQMIIGEVEFTSEEEIIKKVKLAHLAKKNWKELGVRNRIAVLIPLIEIFNKRKAEIISLTVREIGKTIMEAKSDFVSDMEYLEAFLTESENYIADEITFSEGNETHRIVYEPRGVTACIVPWNYPFTNFIWSVIPNLIVGNTVLFKHSEECPLLGKLFEEIMLDLPNLPQGVFSEIYGDSETGELLLAQDIDMIWFTGSSLIGKKILAHAREKQIKTILEMGGSNPTIIFDDVNINKLILSVYKARFTNCGQACDATKRLIIHKNIYDHVIHQLIQHIHAIQIGDPEKASTELGPLAAMRQLLLLEDQVQDAIDQGAHILTGGSRPSNFSGAYYLPTLVSNIKKSMRLWKEEVFGPVLPIVSFETEAEALELANDTVYGLGAVIYSNDLNRARRMAAQINAGCVDINNGNHWRPCNPFGGHKASGMGVEHGRQGFQELCQIKVIAEG